MRRRLLAGDTMGGVELRDAGTMFGGEKKEYDQIRKISDVDVLFSACRSYAVCFVAFSNTVFQVDVPYYEKAGGGKDRRRDIRKVSR